jgi:hypothetical protein
MSDGGKGSTPRPFSVDLETFNRNFDAIFGYKEDKVVRVSGVPYEVDLEADVATLEQENKQMRARMERLEDENRRLEEEIIQLRIQLHNAQLNKTILGEH